MIFKGSGVALVTPFTNDKVDYHKLGRLIEWHLDMGTDALVVVGTTGEAATLSQNERKEIIKFTVKKVKKQIPVIAGTGNNSTRVTIELSKDAEAAGADGLLIVTPYYNKPTQEGLYEHFKLVAKNTSLPIIIYNVPGRTSVNIKPYTVLKLSQIKNIVGIKEASGDIGQVAEIASLCPKGFAIYSGNDDQIVPILSLGGMGVISVLANILPKEVHNIFINYFEGKTKEAAEKQLASIDLIKALFIETNPIPIKAAMNLMGMDVGSVRLPLTKMSEHNENVLKNAMKEMGLIDD